ncbi:hypothetical protein MYX07_03450 [Patescibacteria group bacterium AH-259-L07]|nr:hypothetical protein [Patescibacteria group bacterium AH-259-L07]
MTSFCAGDKTGCCPASLYRPTFSLSSRFFFVIPIVTAEKEAQNFITEHEAKLNRLVKQLVKKETLDGDVVYKILGEKYPN